MNKSPDQWSVHKGHARSETEKAQKRPRVRPKALEHVVGALKKHAGWVVGQEVTEAEYDAALSKLMEEPIL